MTKIQVPELMLKAAMDVAPGASENWTDYVPRSLEAALQWLSLPEGVISDEVLETCMKWVCANGHINLRDLLHELKEWRKFRRMFLAEPEIPEVPKEIADLMWSDKAPSAQEHNEDVIAAYCRGTDSRGQRSKGSV